MHKTPHVGGFNIFNTVSYALFVYNQIFYVAGQR